MKGMASEGTLQYQESLNKMEELRGLIEHLVKYLGVYIRLNVELSKVLWVEVVNMAFFVLKGKFLIYIEREVATK